MLLVPPRGILGGRMLVGRFRVHLENIALPCEMRFGKRGRLGGTLLGAPVLGHGNLVTHL